jgi:CHAT domain-containing protein
LEERRESQPQPRDSAPLHFRAGLANLHFNQLQEGVRNFEEMLQAISEYEAQEKNKLETVRNAESFSTFQLVTAIVWMPVAFISDPFGSISNVVSGAIKSNRDAATIQALFGKHLNGLPAFLNEHERIAFHSELGYAYERLNRRPEAIPQYKAAIELIERERSSLGSEGKRIEFLSDKEIVYKRLVPLLIENGQLEEAWQYMERARSRAFVDLLAGSRLHLGSAADTNRYQAAIQKQAEMEMLVQEGRVPREVVPQIHSTLRGIKTVKDETKTTTTAVKEETKTATTAEFDSLAAVQTATIADVQSVAGRDAAVLAFFVGDYKTTVMLLQDGRLTAWVAPVGRERLTQQVQQFRSVLESPGKQDTAALQEIHARGRELYRDLMAAPASILKKSVLYILPHGPLHYLPFAALYDGTGYVLDRVTLLTVPSATVLTYLEKKPRARQGATVIFANPDLGDAQFDLPYADQEGTAIHTRVPAAVLLRRGEATETLARSRALDAKVLHFAAHATFKQDRPLDSAVMLAPGGGQDGALTAGEIFGLTLPGSLVVLSACETGRGKLAAGDELIGLTRAFMYAGAPQLLATLWQVDDKASSMLMDEFYRELTNRPPADALRLAQTKVRATYAHPFYWAAFTTYGLYR